MRKYLVIAIILAAVGGVIWGVFEFLQYKDVTFALSDDVSKVDVYVEDENIEEKKPVATVSRSNTTIRLRAGSYEYVPSGEKVAKDSTQIIIDKSMTIPVDPNYSETYLSSITEAELSALSDTLTAKYPEQMEQFTANNIKLFGKGEWAGVLLTPVGMDPQSPGGYYRVLAQKKSGTWSLVGKPEIVLTKYTTPTAPLDMLTSVNSLSLR